MIKEEINIRISSRCPRCDGMTVKSWAQLNDEEKEVVRRLPQSAEYSLAERQARHRWCTRCWFEESAEGEILA